MAILYNRQKRSNFSFPFPKICYHCGICQPACCRSSAASCWRRALLCQPARLLRPQPCPRPAPQPSCSPRRLPRRPARRRNESPPPQPPAPPPQRRQNPAEQQVHSQPKPTSQACAGTTRPCRSLARRAQQPIGPVFSALQSTSWISRNGYRVRTTPITALWVM